MDSLDCIRWKIENVCIFYCKKEPEINIVQECNFFWARRV